jgi:hypothetical protein
VTEEALIGCPPWSILYIFALQPLSVFAILRIIRSDLPACRVPCQSPEISPFACVSLAGAGAAAALDCEVWALAGFGDAPRPRKVAHTRMDIVLDIIFTVIQCSVFVRYVSLIVLVRIDYLRQAASLGWV